MKRNNLLLLIFISAILLSACGGTQNPPASTSTPIPAPTQTPDPCSKDNLPTEAKKVNDVMREFDDASLLAANTTKDQLLPAISNLQRIRREAQDLTVPSCLANLYKLELQHMDTVITTLISFMGGADQANLNKGIDLARQQHNAYTLELSRLLGLTMVAPTAAPTQAGTSITPPPATQAASAPLTITNPGPNPVNLRRTPDLNGETLGTLNVNATAIAHYQTSDGTWYLVEIPTKPGQTAWVYASLVKLSGPASSLPIATPNP